MTKQNDEVAELREATREAHEAMSDMKRLMKEVREVIGELRAAAHVEVDEMITEEVRKGLDAYKAVLDKAIETATESVYARFDKIGDLILGEDSLTKKKGLPSIEDMVRGKVDSDHIRSLVEELVNAGAQVQVVDLGASGGGRKTSKS